MSWMPDKDPLLGDKHSCDALELIIIPRVRDLGDGFNVRRALPHGKRQMIGPFIFFDQMGPVQLVAGRGMDVRPHPHIGLATVTYLFDGRVTHRDSEGNDLEITPGAMNLMTAGRGISHSERTPATMRATGGGMFGIQSWIALPQDHEEMAPLFEHFDAAVLPSIADKGVRARVIAGSVFGQKSPVGMVSEWFYAEVLLEAGASAPLDADHEERAIYVAEGEVDIAGDKFAAPQLLVFRPGDRIKVTATQAIAPDVPGRRCARRSALSVVEFRLLAQGAHRRGEGGMEDRQIRPHPGRREGIHPAAGALKRSVPQPQRVGDDAHRRQRHRCRSDHRRQNESENRIKNTRGDRDRGARYRRTPAADSAGCCAWSRARVRAPAQSPAGHL